MLDLVSFNNSLTPEARHQIVDKVNFDAYHKNTKYSKLEGIARDIQSVDQIIENGIHTGYIAEFRNGNKITAKFDGTYYKSNGRQAEVDNTGHFRLVVNDYSLIIEKFIGICQLIENDTLPLSFQGLCVNVMDLSGTQHARKKFGLKADFSLDNLEWCLAKSENLLHANLVHGVYSKLHKIYRISAHDRGLDAVCNTQSKTVLQLYLNMNGYKRVK